MTWDQAQALKASGFGIGNHSFNHDALGVQPGDIVRKEVSASRTLIDDRLGGHNPYFSYPYGRGTSVNDMTDQVISSEGYECSVTLEADVVRAPGSNLLRLPRLIVPSKVDRLLFGLWQRFIG
jgi:peptidoglycan/xylan/chitin deacetylase (PgdA/CDA1 family)